MKTVKAAILRAIQIIESCKKFGCIYNTALFEEEITRAFKPKNLASLKKITIDNLLSIGLDKFSAQCVIMVWSRFEENEAGSLDLEEEARVLFWALFQDREWLSSILFIEDTTKEKLHPHDFIKTWAKGKRFCVYPPGTNYQTGPNIEATYERLCDIVFAGREDDPEVIIRNGELCEVTSIDDMPAAAIIINPLNDYQILGENRLADGGFDWSEIPLSWAAFLYCIWKYTKEHLPGLPAEWFFEQCKSEQGIIGLACLAPNASKIIARSQRFNLTNPLVRMPLERRNSRGGLVERLDYPQVKTSLGPYQVIRPQYENWPKFDGSDELDACETLLARCVTEYSWDNPTSIAGKMLKRFAGEHPFIVVAKDGTIDIPRTLFLINRLAKGCDPWPVFIQGKEFYEVVSIGEVPLKEPYRIHPFSHQSATVDEDPRLQALDDVTLSLLSIIYTNQIGGLDFELEQMVSLASGTDGLEKLIRKYPQAGLILAQRIRCGLSLPILSPYNTGERLITKRVVIAGQKR